MTRTHFVALAVLAVLVAAPARSESAQDGPAARPPGGSLTDLTGVWTMLVEGHQFGLEQDDGTLDGELSTNRGRTKWTGERLKAR